MRFKKDKKYKTKVISIRCTESEYNLIKRYSNLYTEGNLSEYIIYCSTHYKSNEEDIEKERAIYTNKYSPF